MLKTSTNCHTKHVLILFEAHLYAPVSMDLIIRPFSEASLLVAELNVLPPISLLISLPEFPVTLKHDQVVLPDSACTHTFPRLSKRVLPIDQNAILWGNPKVAPWHDARLLTSREVAKHEIPSIQDQTLQAWREALLLLDHGVDGVDGVAGLKVQSEGLAGQRLDKDLHAFNTARLGDRNGASTTK